MILGTTQIAAAEIAELLDLVDRLSRLVPKLAAALSVAAKEQDQLRWELTNRAIVLREAHPGHFTHFGQLVRWLRETAELTRLQLQAQTGISAPTIRNIEKNRHKLTAATLRKLLAHPAMATLLERAKVAGLSLGPRTNEGSEAMKPPAVSNTIGLDLDVEPE
jgi:DNA-binding XRE family transcriptional regulator